VDDPPHIHDGVQACITIQGAYHGSLTLTCTRDLARYIAAALFDTPADDLDEADVLDALGETVNIIGGGVKALLPQPSKLGLPVTRPQADPLTIPALYAALLYGQPLTLHLTEGEPCTS
jgi:chemotaxis protein CheX